MMVILEFFVNEDDSSGMIVLSKEKFQYFNTS